MTDATSHDPSGAERHAETAEKTYSAAIALGPTLRVIALVGIGAAVLGVLVAPGMRGNAAENAVNATDFISATASYAFAILAVYAIAQGSYDLMVVPTISMWSRAASIVFTLPAVAICATAFRSRVPLAFTLALALVASWKLVSAGAFCLRGLHTRAAGLILLLCGFSAAARLFAWELANVAAERSNVALYGFSRGVATTALVLAAASQLVAAAWIGTRSRGLGQWAASVAIGLALVLTWGAAEGGATVAQPWQTVLHSALGDARTAPAPYGLGAIAIFLAPSSLLLALAALIQRQALSATTAVVAFALMSQGATDTPMRALAALSAAVWGVLVTADRRALFRTLELGARKEA